MRLLLKVDSFNLVKVLFRTVFFTATTIFMMGRWEKGKEGKRERTHIGINKYPNILSLNLSLNGQHMGKRECG